MSGYDVRYTDALADVMAERQRQVSREGYAPESDFRWTKGELAKAASCYLETVCARRLGAGDWLLNLEVPRWPWTPELFKPKSDRRDLVRAAALILAELERLDRMDGREA